ncbi:hypothetical protein FOZ62_019498, partial [Perkinsus olseni]
VLSGFQPPRAPDSRPNRASVADTQTGISQLAHKKAARLHVLLLRLVVVTVADQETDEQLRKVRELMRDYPPDHLRARKTAAELPPLDSKKVHVQLRLCAPGKAIPGKTLSSSAYWRGYQVSLILWVHE